MTGYQVTSQSRNLELSNVGSAINLRVRKGGHVLGRVKLGKGSMFWYPAGAVNPKKVEWAVLARMMKDWPFGDPRHGKLKVERGALYWKAKGASRWKRYKWDEVARRLA